MGSHAALNKTMMGEPNTFVIEAVSFANEAATISVTRLDAQASAPALEELKGFGEKLKKTSTDIVSS